MTAADDLRALSAAATPGPWRNGFPRVIAATGGEARDLAFSVSRVADARLIVWCRNHADALADLIDVAEEVWRCKRCNGGGLIAPGSCCQTCAGDGIRVEWDDDGSDLRPLIDALAALEADQ